MTKIFVPQGSREKKRGEFFGNIKQRIPDGWIRLNLEDVTSLQRGFDLPMSQRELGEIPIISSGGQTGWHNESRVHGPGIVTGRYGSIGKIFFIRGDFWPLNTTLWVKDFHGNDEQFAYYLLQTIYFAKYSDKTGVPGINRNDIHRIKVLLPPIPEQRKIAEILRTWDVAIEKLEALRVAKERHKRGLMQILLTGKLRFPEFNGQPWREVRLGEVAEVLVSTVDKKSNQDERFVRLCNYTDVYKNEKVHPNMQFMEATATPAQIEKFGLRFGDVIITKDSERPDDIAVPTFVEGTTDDLVCGYHLAIIRTGDQADGQFLKHCFELPRTQYYFGSRANGATRFGLTVGSIESALFRFPSLNEQCRIAEVIETAQEELFCIDDELEELTNQKRGLMQKLLTGDWRVNTNDYLSPGIRGRK